MMEALFKEYVQAMEFSWADSSKRSESNRLNGRYHLIDGDPHKFWESLKELQPYTRTTYWTRLTSFYQWCIENGKVEGPNPYQAFRNKYKKFFKNTYVKRPCKMTYQEAKTIILNLPPEYTDIKNRLLLLLEGALRRTESHTLTDDGYVMGKGGKTRKVYVPKIEGPMSEESRYSTMLRILKPFGITPHKLRSIRLTKAAEDGASMAELVEIAGWSGPGPALSYIAARDGKISKLMKPE